MTETETENPTGPAMWGQDARYTAYDDRLALTALTGGRTGICRPASFSPADTGPLDVVMAAGWLAFGDAGDGTVMAAGAPAPVTVTLLPGDETGPPRTDLIYCWLAVDDGRWQAGTVPAGQEQGSPGIALATVEVPAGATSAAQMVITPRPAEFTIEGARGPAGPPGPQGPVGPAVSINGTLDSPADLPAAGSPGDAWLIAGDLWIWTGS